MESWCLLVDEANGACAGTLAPISRRIIWSRLDRLLVSAKCTNEEKLFDAKVARGIIGTNNGRSLGARL